MKTHTEKTSQRHQKWHFDINNRMLLNGPSQLSLTKIESLIVESMYFKEERIISREELIYSIGREPGCYRGLKMNLSRLQAKFKNCFDGERLFRAVRNRGYCLTQVIKGDIDESRSG